MKHERIEKSIDYAFRNGDLLRKALTHSSYAYENRPEKPEDNELLEFLGDSVIGLATAEFYLRAFPDRTEGELSKLKASATSTLALARQARRIRLDKAILLGKGEEKSRGRSKNSILAGAFEALMGAVFLDGGFDAASGLIRGLLAPSLEPIRTESFQINNYKSALQELLQRDDQPVPVYRTVTSKGPEHRKTFTVEVTVNGRRLGRAKGPSKKSAEQKAAQKALKSFLGRRMKEISPEAFIVEGDG
jgi:ribonuclease-3